MSTWFKVCIEVPESKVGTIVQLLLPEGRNLQLTQLQYVRPSAGPDDHLPPAAYNRLPKRVPIKRPKKGDPKLSPPALIMTALDEGPKPTRHLCKVVATYGWSRSSANSACYTLAREGKVKRIGPALWAKV